RPEDLIERAVILPAADGSAPIRCPTNAVAAPSRVACRRAVAANTAARSRRVGIDLRKPTRAPRAWTHRRDRCRRPRRSRLSPKCGHVPRGGQHRLTISLENMGFAMVRLMHWTSRTSSTCAGQGEVPDARERGVPMLKRVLFVFGIVVVLGVVSAATAQYGGGGGMGGSGGMSGHKATSGGYTSRHLVADTAGAAAQVDPNLVNGWGLVAGPSTPWWVNNNHTDTSTLYDATGAVLPLVVTVPGGPTGILNINGTIFVTYAKQDKAKMNDAPGAGFGFVDAFDTSGNLLTRVASRGVLNAPWGLALAPSDFGAFSGDLLVGNFGNGMIHAYQQQSNGSWKLHGALRVSKRKQLRIDGLWGLQFGNGGPAGPTNTLYFTAGPKK